MEQEETKTTAAAGVEMPPEAESWVQLHESELTELMQKQAKAAITELKRQEKQERKERFFRFHNAILEGYRQQMSGDKNTLFKMKELWAYWGENFADADQRLKKNPKM